MKEPDPNTPGAPPGGMASCESGKPAVRMSVRGRILSAVAASGFGRLMRFADQIVLVPLFLGAWGAAQYGEWITLFSLAAAAGLAQFGLADAAVADMVLRHSAGDPRGAARSFSTFMLALAVTLTSGFLLVAVASLWTDFAPFGADAAIPKREAQMTLIVICASQLLLYAAIPVGGVLGTVFGAWLPAMFFAVEKVVEISGVALGLWLGASATGIACIMLASTALYALVSLVVALKYAPWLKLSGWTFDRGILLKSWKASAGFFSLHAATMVIAVYAPRLIVAALFGPAVTTSFVIMTTYTRASRLVAVSVSQAAQLEMSRAFGGGRLGDFTSLVATTAAAALLITAALLSAGLLFAPVLIPLWTRDLIQYDWATLLAFSAVALAGAWFDSLAAAAGAINRIAAGAGAYLVGLIAALVVSPMLAGGLGIAAIALGLIIPEVLGGVAALRTLRAAAPALRLNSGWRSLWRAREELWRRR